MSTGSSFLHTGQVVDTKNRSWLFGRSPPILTSVPLSAGSSKAGAFSPSFGPASVTSAPMGATRSYRMPTWRARAHRATITASIRTHSRAFEIIRLVMWFNPARRV